MVHQFEISDRPGADDTLLLVYPPKAIRELNGILDRIEQSRGKLPELLHTPVKGLFLSSEPIESAMCRGDWHTVGLLRRHCRFL